MKLFGPKEKKIEQVEKTWNGEPVPKIRFVVVDPNNPKKEKWFDVGNRSATLIVDKLREGHRLMPLDLRDR